MEQMFWLDMEMSGLDVSKERILETAVIVTDLKFNVLRTYDTAVFQAPELLEAMDPWCKDHHGKSGLVKRVETGISEGDLDHELCAIAKTFIPKGKIVLCGNSIGQDRKFIEKYLPKFTEKLHYRMLDVSSIKLIFENMFSIKFKKENKHRALDDIRESIAELSYYLGYLNETKLGKTVPSFVTGETATALG